MVGVKVPSQTDLEYCGPCCYYCMGHEKGMAQAKVAERVGVSGSTIYLFAGHKGRWANKERGSTKSKPGSEAKKAMENEEKRAERRQEERLQVAATEAEAYGMPGPNRQDEPEAEPENDPIDADKLYKILKYWLTREDTPGFVEHGRVVLPGNKALSHVRLEIEDVGDSAPEITLYLK